MKALLIGYGQIGKAVCKVCSEYHEIHIHDPHQDYYAKKKDYDIMLVAIPYSEKFVDIIREYKDIFHITNVIVFSTVQIGTCSKIGAAHSPVEGKHPDLAQSIVEMKRWVGGGNLAVYQFLQECNFDLKVVGSPEYTEFLKLRSTSLYGVNIEFARYSKDVADKIGMDFNFVKEFDEDYNNLYKAMGLTQFQRYILDPPEAEIGGHCVRPNAKILDEKFPSEFLKRIYN